MEQIIYGVGIMSIHSIALLDNVPALQLKGSNNTPLGSKAPFLFYFAISLSTVSANLIAFLW